VTIPFQGTATIQYSIGETDSENEDNQASYDEGAEPTAWPKKGQSRQCRQVSPTSSEFLVTVNRHRNEDAEDAMDVDKEDGDGNEIEPIASLVKMSQRAPELRNATT
jgi:hypothetical protein